MIMKINVFVRQPFTQSSNEDRSRIQSVMDGLFDLKRDLPLRFLTPLKAQSQDSFKQFFEQDQKKEFTPKNFRDYRLSLIGQADAFIVIRTALSESGAFELAYNIFKANKAPVFFAVWEQAPIKTTLLRDLSDLCDVSYETFSQPIDLKASLQHFFHKCISLKTPA